MKLQKLIWPLLTLVLAVGLGVAFGNRAISEADLVPIVKTYKVPSDQAPRARGALQRLFSSVESASAQSLGNGLLLVRMPKSFESGVDSVIHEIKQMDSSQHEKIRMDYWVLRASSDPISNQKDLKPLKEVIQSINETDGTQHYQVLEHISSNSSLGRGAKVKGWLSRIESHVVRSIDPGEYALGLTFETKFGRIETNTKIADGEFMVLGQNAANKKKLIEILKSDYFAKVDGTAGNNKIYFVIRGTKVN